MTGCMLSFNTSQHTGLALVHCCTAAVPTCKLTGLVFMYCFTAAVLCHLTTPNPFMFLLTTVTGRCAQRPARVGMRALPDKFPIPTFCIAFLLFSTPTNSTGQKIKYSVQQLNTCQHTSTGHYSHKSQS